jgi:integrase
MRRRSCVLAPLEQAGKLETLRRGRQRVGAVLAYAVQTGRRTDNPIRDMQGAFDAPERRHFASIAQADLPAFLRRLDSYQGAERPKAIIRMILWTACRTGEIRGARPGEFDLDAGVWTIPAERMKKRRPHVVPLPSQAVAMLRALETVRPDAAYAFPSPAGADQQASENIVLQALKKMGYGGKLTGHGLRTAVATGLEESGYSTEIVKAQLSHAKGNLTDAAYLRGVHLERRAAMMQQWADSLDGLHPVGNVIAMKAA